MDDIVDTDYLALTAEIVSAHVRHNAIPAAELPSLIQAVHAALAKLGSDPTEAPRAEPAVPIKRSVFPSYIVCLEDGKKLKMLKRHLQTAYGMTPEEYRQKWGLPPNYPMVAPDYAEHRSALAKSIGLGKKPGVKAPDEPVEEMEEPAAAKPKKPARKAGRPRKTV